MSSSCSTVIVATKVDVVLVCKTICFLLVTNPIDVIKTRMQLENELGSQHESRNIFHNRYYRGLIRGATRVAQEEGLRGLYKG